MPHRYDRTIIWYHTRSWYGVIGCHVVGYNTILYHSILNDKLCCACRRWPGALLRLKHNTARHMLSHVWQYLVRLLYGGSGGAACAIAGHMTEGASETINSQFIGLAYCCWLHTESQAAAQSGFPHIYGGCSVINRSVISLFPPSRLPSCI